jgi:predicted metallo-beta-lactamase superfamily hydrolase
LENPAIHISGKIQLSQDMTITPIAAESLGVRSLATQVRTSTSSILIDPGVALGFREGLHPHPIEYQLLSEIREHLLSLAPTTDLIVVSHFHHDHFLPFYRNFAYFWSGKDEASQLYSGRSIWCKDIRSNINYSQQRRGYNFVRSARKIAQEVSYADGRATKHKDTVIRFSPAVPHGEKNTKLGWVIMTVIKCGDFSMVHASDTQGPMEKPTTDWILGQKPDVLLLAGPPTYLSPDRVTVEIISEAAANLKTLTAAIPMVIIDHHLLRDQAWVDWLDPVRQHASDHGHQLMTVAEVLGLPDNLLEATRKTLYEKTPVTSAFENWVKQIQGRRTTKPPPLP